MEKTQVRAMLKTTFRVKEDYIHIELEVSDHSREGENTAAALDRVFGLVERKVAEKAQKYIDNS